MTDQQVTITQWNIKDGGFGRRDGTADPGYDRLDAIGDAIEATAPDVVALNEVRDRRRYWGPGATLRPADDPYPLEADRERLEPLAARLGMKLAGVTPTVSGIPSAVLYQPDRLGPARWRTDHDYLFTNGFGIAEFTPTWLERPFAVAAVHIGPWSRTQILAETGAAVARLTEYYQWAVLAGDFNALPAYGPFGDPLKMKPHHRAIHLKDPNGPAWPRPNLEPARVLSDAGFCDLAELVGACQARDGESEADLNERVRTGQAARIDRIHLTGHLAACGIAYARIGTPALSDHYGTTGTFDLAHRTETDPWIAWRRRQLQESAT